MEGIPPFLALLALAICLIVMGFEGSLGKVIAVIFSPQEVQAV